MNKTLFFTLIVVLGVGGGYLVARPLSGVVQPIAFNHNIHIENGLDCSVCHERYEMAAVAGRPKLETCLLCHETALTESAEEEKVRQLADQGVKIPWRRIYRLPDHVYFSHQTHVVSGQVKCDSCHGGIAHTTTPPLRPEVEVSMDNCIACHQSRNVTTDCNACHR